RQQSPSAVLQSQHRCGRDVGAAHHRSRAGRRPGSQRAARRRMRRAMADQIDWETARLWSTRELAPNVRLFEIEPRAGFIAPSPGSHIRVMVDINGRPDMRCYSTVGPCRDGRYRIAVKRHDDSRGGSAYLWSLSEGARLTVSPPANHFALNYSR